MSNLPLYPLAIIGAPKRLEVKGGYYHKGQVDLIRG